MVFYLRKYVHITFNIYKICGYFIYRLESQYASFQANLNVLDGIISDKAHLKYIGG